MQKGYPELGEVGDQNKKSLKGSSLEPYNNIREGCSRFKKSTGLSRVRMATIEVNFVELRIQILLIGAALEQCHTIHYAFQLAEFGELGFVHCVGASYN